MSSIAEMMKRARARLLRRGTSPEDADDYVQEAYARMEAYTRAQDVRSREAFLVSTAVNISIDEQRRRRRAPFRPYGPEAEHAPDAQPAADDAAYARQRLAHAAEGLARLSPKARRILLAKRVEGLTYAQIATREQMGLFAVEKQLARSVAFMMKWMQGW